MNSEKKRGDISLGSSRPKSSGSKATLEAKKEGLRLTAGSALEFLDPAFRGLDWYPL